MAISLRQLRAFAAVAESESFTAAARQLNLTQSALSVLVRELESDVGVRLFDRHTRGVALTEAGREFQPRVQRLLSDLNEAVKSVADLGASRKGIVRLVAPQLIASAMLPGAITAYRKKYPGVEVRLSDALPENVLDGLATGAADLAFGVLPHDESVEASVFLEDPFLFICRPDHPLAQRRKVRWSEIDARTFIGPTRDFRRYLLPQLDARTRERMENAPGQDVSYLTTALGLVRAGEGVSAGPSYASEMVRSYGLRMIELCAPVVARQVSVYRAARREPTPAASAFVETLREFILEHPPWEAM